jgi:hypothetical protein
MEQLLLWRERMETGLEPQTISRRFEAGDDVEGLADLPIREMLDHLRREFPGAKESAGLLQWQSGEEAMKATWSWQYLRFDVESLNEEHREKIFELGRHFHCPIYAPAMNLRMGKET